jgi:hypothetical protein
VPLLVGVAVLVVKSRDFAVRERHARRPTTIREVWWPDTKEAIIVVGRVSERYKHGFGCADERVEGDREDVENAGESPWLGSGPLGGSERLGRCIGGFASGDTHARRAALFAGGTPVSSIL